MFLVQKYEKNININCELLINVYLCIKNHVTMIIKKAEFTVSAPDVRQCPQGNEPEYAFIGRSNVGKSSLINMLVNHSGLAKTSSMPGKTMLINHFLITSSSEDSDKERRKNDSPWYVVDLPGYGYAKRSKHEQDKLVEMIRRYVLMRQQMACLFVLIDSRLEPQRIDLEFIEWLGENGVPFAIVFTKSDKLSHAKTQGNVRTFMQRLEEQWEELPPHFVTSAESREGREELLDYISSINKSIEG